MFAGNFEIVSPLPDSILSGDSAAVTILLKGDLQTDVLSDSLTGILEAGVLNIYNNDPSKSVFRVSLLAEFDITEIYTLNMRMFIQGLYLSERGTSVNDSVTLYLRNSNPPFELVDSGKSVLDSSGFIVFKFVELPNESSYSLQIRHRNSLETWSVISGLSFTDKILNYDFTDSASKAFGNNQLNLNESINRFGIISGDVNQDGSIDGSDLLIISNDAASLMTGYITSDINGDGFVDGSDALITGNNAEAFLISITP